MWRMEILDLRYNNLAQTPVESDTRGRKENTLFARRTELIYL